MLLGYTGYVTSGESKEFQLVSQDTRQKSTCAKVGVDTRQGELTSLLSSLSGSWFLLQYLCV